MKTRWKILIGAGIVLALAILIPVIHHYQLRFAVEKYIAELKAKGEPMDLTQVIPPPVPPEQNSAPLFWKAVALFTTNNDILTTNWPLAMHGIIPGKAIVSWAQPEIRYENWSNSWDQLREALVRNREAFNLLNQITNNSIFDFNLQYERRFEMTITNLVFEKKAAQKLSANAIYNLHVGNVDLAAKNTGAIFVLVNGTADERTAISQLVRIAIAQIGVAATWGLLQATNATEQSLADLQAVISQMEFIHAEENVLPVEREGSENSANKWRQSGAEFDKYFDLMEKARESFGSSTDDESETVWDRVKFDSQKFLWRYWWSYPDELRSLKGYEVLLATVRSIETNGSFQQPLSAQNDALDKLGISKLNNSLDALFGGDTDFHSMLSESIMTLANVTRKVMQVEISKEVCITAIALKRYQLKHGNYPPDLNSLVPEFVSAIPLDPIDGKPLRYKLNSDGTFLLYSVGENGVDDGGNPALEKGVTPSSFQWQNPHALDWVWPQPATEAEIQTYYAHLPK